MTSSRRSYATACAGLWISVWFAIAPLAADPPNLLKIFSRKSVEADPQKDYVLTREDGPWMILAGTFSGKNGLEQARRLVLELRSDYDLPAFIFKESFDFSGQVDDVRTTDDTPVRYLNPKAYDTFSVMVGEFDSVEHPQVEKILETVKTARPKAFEMEGSDDNPLGMIRRIHQQWTKQKADRGPMARAFVTRNPLLPEKFFQRPEVDAFVMNMNKDVEYSLLDNPGEFTVVVRTFEGHSTIVDGKNDQKFKPSAKRLNEFAVQANKMVTALRKDGVEAYEYHDRYRSLVTVGSFNDLGVRNAAGKFQYHPDIQAVMQRYSAGSNVVRTGTGRLGLKANAIKGIPYDVQPKPIAVPKKSKRSLYMATRNALGND